MGLMSGGLFSMTFDAASLARMATLVNAAPIFAAAYQTAMGACVAKVVTESKNVASTSFANPTGTLMRGITGYVETPWRGIVGVGQQVPYARRREYGFSGMTDALGRTYTDDPGAMYLHQGLENSRTFIRSAFFGATQLAIREMIL